jgi:3-hydroxyacyl-[acyl-carrier-protein] dehydratase
MPSSFIVDPKQLSFDRPLASLDEIRCVNPQRDVMEQLTAIVHIDTKQHIIAGYKDVSRNEFWVRGYLPDYPMMPPVLMCEAVAQLCSYYIRTQGLLGGDFIAFGGMNDVKFRSAIQPGCRLVLAARAKEIRAGRIVTFSSQGIVDQALVFEADILGVPFSWQAKVTGVPASISRNRR